MRLAFALVMPVLVAACGTAIHTIHTNPPPHALAPRPPDSVEVYTASVPERPFVEVAFFEAQQESQLSFDDSGAMLGKLRAEAAANGCDGIIVTGPNDRVVGDRKNVDTLHGYAATCIVYR